MIKPSLEPLKKEVPDAYHGTELSKAQSIASSQRFIPRGEPNSYLGLGVYFFEGSIEAAVWMAKERHRTAARYGIIQATVQLGRCLDLTARENRDKLKYWQKIVAQRLKGKEVTDTAVINSFAHKCEGGFDTVRCVFLPDSPRPIYKGSRIWDLRLVICVRNLDNISNISLIRTGEI